MLTRKSPINALRFGVVRFRREERLKGKNDIREVFNKGKRIGCRGAKLFVLKNNLPHNRICFTFPRGFGTAVQRNRARRLGREAYRNLKPGMVCGYDLILLVYPDDTKATLAEPTLVGESTLVGGSTLVDESTLVDRMGQLRYLLARAGLLR